jgi:hypothetical protein
MTAPNDPAPAGEAVEEAWAMGTIRAVWETRGAGLALACSSRNERSKPE